MAVVVFLVFIVLNFRLYLFLMPKNRLTVLMYHQIAKNSTDALTVSPENLEKQFQYLSKFGYNALFFKDLNKIKTKKPLIITFDDGYLNNAEFLPALLQKYGLKATIFIATEFIEKGYKNFKMMTFSEIASLDHRFFEIGLHSHDHKNYKTLTAKEAAEDLEKNMKILSENNIEFTKVFAYPYGGFPRKTPEKEELFAAFERLGIDFAVRIGNKINHFPTKQKYEICRIDVRGNDSFLKFKLKLIFGKLKLF